MTKELINDEELKHLIECFKSDKVAICAYEVIAPVEIRMLLEELLNRRSISSFDTEYCFDCKQGIKTERQESLNMIAKHYGKRPQLRQLQEECAELIQAVSKVCRKEDTGDKFSLENLIEEIADVEIMIYQIKYLCKIQALVEEAKVNKIVRTLERIGNE